ncbi:unnamed protein product [Didymodactylos carnosus]|uniref:Uncharacterized protein n=1 Tax=Didymodactylos carnosus TaxID=1234261 RepID=A0A8S2WTS4_9BILA|nr:unnamed protein product [Didymodactylos carnosus]
MLELQNTTSALAEEITSLRLSLRKKWIPMKGCAIDFPQLSLEYLRHFTCGSYQLKQSKSYAKSHLDKNDDLDVELSSDKDNLLRCRIQSRHQNSTKYYLCIKYDPSDSDEPILDKYCQCKSGNQTIGSYAHTATVVWYLGYARFTEWKPSQRGTILFNSIASCRPNHAL